MKKIKKTINQLDIPSAIFGSIIGSIVAFVSFMKLHPEISNIVTIIKHIIYFFIFIFF